MLLGILGLLLHARCRDCGMDMRHEITDDELEADHHLAPGDHDEKPGRIHQV
jgi:hypothetical protein